MLRRRAWCALLGAGTDANRAEPSQARRRRVRLGFPLQTRFTSGDRRRRPWASARAQRRQAERAGDVVERAIFHSFVQRHARGRGSRRLAEGGLGALEGEGGMRRVLKLSFPIHSSLLLLLLLQMGVHLNSIRLPRGASRAAHECAALDRARGAPQGPHVQHSHPRSIPTARARSWSRPPPPSRSTRRDAWPMLVVGPTDRRTCTWTRRCAAPRRARSPARRSRALPWAARPCRHDGRAPPRTPQRRAPLPRCRRRRTGWPWVRSRVSRGSAWVGATVRGAGGPLCGDG